MTTYEFSLELLETLSEESAADRVYADIDDATLLTFGNATRLAFDREASSLAGAIRSAITDVERCGLHVVRVETEETQLVERINSQLAPAE